IPSLFVKRSFIKMGIPERKLFVNGYGSSSIFKPLETKRTTRPFRIIYFGSMSIRKGVQYLFQALNELTLDYEAWFLGSIDSTIENLLKGYNDPRWKAMGHIEHTR